MRRIQTKAERTHHALKRAGQRSKRRVSEQMARFRDSARKVTTIKADGTVEVTIDGKTVKG